MHNKPKKYTKKKINKYKKKGGNVNVLTTIQQIQQIQNILNNIVNNHKSEFIVPVVNETLLSDITKNQILIAKKIFESINTNTNDVKDLIINIINRSLQAN